MGLICPQNFGTFCVCACVVIVSLGNIRFFLSNQDICALTMDVKEVLAFIGLKIFTYTVVELFCLSFNFDVKFQVTKSF